MGKIRICFIAMIMLLAIVLLFVSLFNFVFTDIKDVSMFYVLMATMVLILLIGAVWAYRIERIQLDIIDKWLKLEEEYNRKCDWMEKELKWRETELELKEKWDKYERNARNADADADLERKIKEHKEKINKKS